MEIYDFTYVPEKWEQFYESFSTNEHAYKADIKRLRAYIDEQKYLEVLKSYESSGKFNVPELIMLNKKGTEKKRIVFSFDENASWLLKFFGYYLHAYDENFSDNLYSFRKERSVKTAIAKLLKVKNISSLYGVKLDIHDYFNSADTDIIITKVRGTLKGQNKLIRLIGDILKDNDYVIANRMKDSDVTSSNNAHSIHKGMMAGSPLSPFLANLYLDDLDKHFDNIDGFYARYSDDIIFFTESEEKRDQEMEYINKVLSENKLTLNPDKIAFIKPGESFEFLGFLFDNGEVDVAHSSFDKIKKKLRRKARAVLRWKLKKDAEPEKAARVYIKYFNHKFFENPIKSELTWCRWYFPIITTDVTIKKIDHYMQECIRYIYTGKHSKRNFNLRYDDIKQLGYRSLVNEYHRKN